MERPDSRSSGTGWISGVPVLTALLFVLSQAPVPGWAARLENFQLPPQTRIAGQYEIVFKAPSALADLLAMKPAARSSALKGAVLPETLPISDADVHALANAIAASVGGHSLIIFPASNGAGGRFTISGVTEASVRRLAADPRIEVIEASSSAFNDSCE
jgi:hypothetical protein